jgi:tetratricopeptide (TPR) repeat protein
LHRVSENPGLAAEAHHRRHRRRTGRGYLRGGGLKWVAAGLLALVLVGAPVALGAVHRTVLLGTLGVVALLVLVTAGLAWRSEQSFRPHVALILPLCFVGIAALQSLPLPTGLRARLDPAGFDLAAGETAGRAVPMSLDPPETHRELAMAGAAAGVALAALVLSAGRRLRLAAPVLVAVAGLATLAVGLGHRAAFESAIYGVFSTSSGVPVGPFINPNHEAELLELSAFTALALACAATTRDRRRAWKAVAAFLAAGALSTISRGSVLALGAGALTWLLFPVQSDEDVPRPRNRFAAVVLALIVVAGLTLSLGGEGVLGEVFATRPGDEGKFRLWLDALKIIPVHPLGIGLGAFARVYPAYQTLSTGLWYEFVENLPLSLLIEAGIPGALLVAGAVALTVRHVAKRARRDRVEAALCAAMVAVLAHNLVDFGLEVPGILFPFVAILGATMGRQLVATDAPVPRRAAVVYAGVVATATVAGIALLLTPSARDYDALLRGPPAADRPALVRAALAAHPTDNQYALLAATLEPLQTTGGGLSPRLVGLNRALRLCPNCPAGHREVARNLWRLGRRQQALLEWRAVVTLDRPALAWVFDELQKSGARPEELATLADDENRFELCRCLLGQRMFEAVKNLLAGRADQKGVEFRLVQASLALAEKDIPGARQASQQALAAGPTDARAALTAAEVEILDGKLDAALGLLRAGLLSAPTNLELNRKLLALLMQTDRWEAVDRALDGLRAALLEHGVPLVEANIAAAQVFERRGQYPRAVSEYRAATVQSPGNVGLLLTLGRLAQMAGQVTVAIDAYRDVLRRAPDNSAARGALSRMRGEVNGRLLEEMLRSPSQTGGGIQR